MVVLLYHTVLAPDSIMDFTVKSIRMQMCLCKHIAIAIAIEI